MEEERKEPLQQESNGVQMGPNEQAWFDGMSNHRPDLNGDREALFEAAKKGYDDQHEFLKRYQRESDELAETLSGNDDLRELFCEIFERGKDGHPELALLHVQPMLKKLLSGEATTEEYLKEKERIAKEAEDAKARKKMQEDAFEAVCAEEGIDPDETAKAMKEALNNPCETEEQCKDQVRMFLKMLNYDAAVEAARVEGRNAKIKEQRRQNLGKRNPSQSAAAPAAPANTKSTLSSIADRAERMRNM